MRGACAAHYRCTAIPYVDRANGDASAFEVAKMMAAVRWVQSPLALGSGFLLPEPERAHGRLVVEREQAGRLGGGVLVLDPVPGGRDEGVARLPGEVGLADAALVAAAVESVIYVVEARSMQAGMVRIALGRLQAAQVNLLGAILTKFEAKRAHLGYGYEYGYGQ